MTLEGETEFRWFPAATTGQAVQLQTSMPDREIEDDGAMAQALRRALAEAAEDDAAPLLSVLAAHGVSARFARAGSSGGYRYEARWRDVLEMLATVGGIDLSTGRLLEGHLNALQLVSLYGTPAQQDRVLAALRAGGFLGVWGADGPGAPTRIVGAGGSFRLAGAKRYASGVGLLSLAVVPARDEDGAQQLLLLSVDEAARADLSTWNHRGMRRTLSGTFDLQGMAVGDRDRLGAPEDYRREPFFVGGIWRCAAAQLGAIEAIVAAVVRGLYESCRDQHPLQTARIGAAILAARTARLWVEDAAERVETSAPDACAEAIARTVALSAYSRIAVENAAMDVIDLAERALGLGLFAQGHPAEAATRDLAVYIRQANPDAVVAEHGRVLARQYLP